MPTSTSRPAEITLPAASIAAVHAALVGSVGAEGAAAALRQSGHAAGDALFRVLLATQAQEVHALPADRFWAQFNRLFSSRGWGQLSYSQPHAGVGALDSGDWAEALPHGNASQPCCHFTTGLLANLLGQVAGGDVAVLEVECRSRGDARCRFLFGGADAVFAVYESIASGTAPAAAVAQLG
jgi:bacteriochlorophyll 4-vinyl reductase